MAQAMLARCLPSMEKGPFRALGIDQADFDGRALWQRVEDPSLLHVDQEIL